MTEKDNYTCLEVDNYPGKESIETVTKFLQGLQTIANAQNESSEISAGGGAFFVWELKIEATGKWS